MLTKIKDFVLNGVKKINDSYEFKPMLSEIEDSPVSPLGRFTFWTVSALILITTLWLIIGKIDIVVNARGIVIPDGEAKIIQPLETGIVKEILVKEGDFVKKGQILISTDSATTDAKLKAVEKSISQSEAEAQRLKAQGLGNVFQVEEKEDMTEEINTQRRLYQENLTSLNSAVNQKRAQISELNSKINSAQAQKRDYESQLKNAKDKEERLKNVLDIISLNDYQQAQDRTNSLKESVNKADSEILALKSQQSQIQNEIIRMNADFKAQNLNTLASLQKQVNEMEANKEQIAFSAKNQKIQAPCDGYIDKLMIHTLGGVVTPAQELIALTPVEKPLIIKAQVLNRDIGFIKTGMPVSIKIDTFDFQKYGILHGIVKSVSQNSINDEKLGPVYEVYITPEQSTLMIEGKEKTISTGMTLNAEIEIGRRRIIEFFIYPLIKYLDEGISVR